jgi:hypothetical protein
VPSSPFRSASNSDPETAHKESVGDDRVAGLVKGTTTTTTIDGGGGGGGLLGGFGGQVGLDSPSHAVSGALFGYWRYRRAGPTASTHPLWQASIDLLGARMVGFGARNNGRYVHAYCHDRCGFASLRVGRESVGPPVVTCPEVVTRREKRRSAGESWHGGSGQVHAQEPVVAG